jgi:AcrR family transcriptional regulator
MNTRLPKDYAIILLLHSIALAVRRTKMTTGQTETLSRRERRKRETRIRIKVAATKLFKKHGFENVTIAQIADAADIDPTTFWRHFRSKLDILCSDQDVWSEQFRRALVSAPAELSIVDAAIEALIISPPVGEAELAEIRYQLTQTERSAETRNAMRAIEDVIRNELAGALAERLGVSVNDDIRPHALSGAIVGAMHWYSEHNVNAVTTDPKEALDTLRIALKMLQG